jgi:hypothetical protein
VVINVAGKRRFEAAEDTKKAALAKVTAATKTPDILEPSMVPDGAIKIMSIEEEKKRSQLLKNDLEDITALTAELVALRERANIDGRIKNLNHMKKLDEFLTGILDMLTKPESIELMEQAMARALNKGDLKQVKELMVAIGIALDKKNAMISESGFTDGRRKNVKIAVNFANDGNTQVGVSVDG